MSQRFRPISEETVAPTTLGTATDVFNANVVRAVNTASSTAYLISIVNESGVTVGSMTLLGNQVAFIDKPKSYKVFAANAAVKLTSVTYPV
jgi:hypothetical protein